MQYKKIKQNKGAAMLLSVIFFLFISLSIIAGVVSPVVASYQNNVVNLNSKKAFYLAESGAEDAVYRIMTNKPISGSETLSLDGQSTTTNITTLGNQKTIESTGVFSRANRKVKTSLNTGTGIAFNYGIQTGNGGFELSGGTVVNGNVYANGPVVASGGARVNGNVFSASDAQIIPTLSHIGSTTPTHGIDFGFQNTSPQDISQSFTVPSSTQVKRVKLYIKRSTSGWMNNITLSINTNSTNKPSQTSLGQIVVPYGDIPVNNYGYVTVTFATPVSLNANTTYWIVLDTGNTWSARYTSAASSATYANGIAKRGTWNSSNGGTWNDTNPAGLDMYFELYPDVSSGLISGIDINGGEGRAYEVISSTVSGGLYCQIGNNNNKLCNTSAQNPSTVPFPIDQNILNGWKDSALSGGQTNGNVTIGWQNGTLGPRKIVGNLTVNGGGTLTLTGPIWITGNLTVNGGGKIVLPSGYSLNSEAIVVDGLTNIAGGGSLGSGTSGSHLFVFSTNACPFVSGCGTTSAITITGGAGAIAVNAQEGEVSILGGGTLNAIIGRRVKASGGATINYHQGLASPSFQSGPSGSWVVDSWREGI
jgi:hypothetical protein